MITIHKYPLLKQVEASDGKYACVEKLPEGAFVLSAGEQGRDLVVWAEIDTDKPLVDHTFHIVGTGREVPRTEACVFIDTVQAASGLVWHIYHKAQ